MKVERKPINSAQFLHENLRKHFLCEFLSDGGDFYIFVKQIHCAKPLRRVFSRKTSSKVNIRLWLRKPSFFPSHFCCWEAKYAAFAFVFSKKWNSSIPSRFWWILLWNEETFTASVLGKSLKSTTSTFREKWSILRWKKLHFTKICRKVGWMLKMFICCFFSWQLKFRRFFFYRSKLSLKKYFLLQFQLHRSILKILVGLANQFQSAVKFI